GRVHGRTGAGRGRGRADGDDAAGKFRGGRHHAAHLSVPPGPERRAGHVGEGVARHGGGSFAGGGAALRAEPDLVVADVRGGGGGRGGRLSDRDRGPGGARA